MIEAALGLATAATLRVVVAFQDGRKWRSSRIRGRVVTRWKSVRSAALSVIALDEGSTWSCSGKVDNVGVCVTWGLGDEER